MGDKLVKSKILCCQLVVFTRCSLLNIFAKFHSDTKDICIDKGEKQALNMNIFAENFCVPIFAFQFCNLVTFSKCSSNFLLIQSRFKAKMSEQLQQ